MADPPSSPGGESGGGSVREQDRYLPRALPPSVKIGKMLKKLFRNKSLSFITSEKTVNGEVLLWAVTTFGFEDYLEPLKVYLARYKEIEGDNKGSGKSGDGSNNRDAAGGGASGEEDMPA